MLLNLCKSNNYIMKTLYFFLLLFFINTVFSQSMYNFEADNNTYQDLTNATILATGDWDDPGFNIPIGFDFQLGTFNFNTISIADWSSGGIVSTVNSATGTIPIMLIIGQDIVSLSNTTSPISYITTGTAGNKIFKLEWKNFGFFDDSTSSDFMNMQLWLYEGSNIIEYHYGNTSINNPAESFEGETGPSIALITGYNMDIDEITDETYILSGNPVNPNVLIYHAGDSGDSTAIDGAIPSGTIYRFIPQNTNSITDFNSLNVRLYPNPSKKYINIELKNNLLIKKIELYNNLGKIILSLKNTSKLIDISYLPNGIYFIKIKDSNDNFILKSFIKE